LKWSPTFVGKNKEQESREKEPVSISLSNEVGLQILLPSTIILSYNQGMADKLDEFPHVNPFFTTDNPDRAEINSQNQEKIKSELENVEGMAATPIGKVDKNKLVALTAKIQGVPPEEVQRQVSQEAGVNKFNRILNEAQKIDSAKASQKVSPENAEKEINRALRAEKFDQIIDEGKKIDVSSTTQIAAVQGAIDNPSPAPTKLPSNPNLFQRFLSWSRRK
jgi:hypothetical protein